MGQVLHGSQTLGKIYRIWHRSQYHNGDTSRVLLKQATDSKDSEQWRKTKKDVTLIRTNWNVPYLYRCKIHKSTLVAWQANLGVFMAWWIFKVLHTGDFCCGPYLRAIVSSCPVQWWSRFRHDSFEPWCIYIYLTSSQILMQSTTHHFIYLFFEH